MAAYKYKTYEVGDYLVHLYKELAVEPPKPPEEACVRFGINYDDRAPQSMYPIIASQAVLVLDVATSADLWTELTETVGIWWIGVEIAAVRIWQGKVESQTMSRDCQTFQIIATDFGQLTQLNLWDETTPFGAGSVQEIMQKVVDSIEIPASNTRWYSGDLGYVSAIDYAGEDNDEGVNNPEAYTDVFQVLHDVALTQRAVAFQRLGEYYFVPIDATDPAQAALTQYNPYNATPQNKLTKLVRDIGDWTETYYQTVKEEQERREGYKDAERIGSFNFTVNQEPEEYLLTQELGMLYPEDIYEWSVDLTFTPIIDLTVNHWLRVRVLFDGYPFGTFPVAYWDNATKTWTTTPASAGSDLIPLTDAGEGVSMRFSGEFYPDATISNGGSINLSINTSSIRYLASLNQSVIDGTWRIRKKEYKEGVMPFYDGAVSPKHRIRSTNPVEYVKCFPPSVGGQDVLQYRAGVPIHTTWLEGEVDGIVQIGTHLEVFGKIWIVLHSKQDFNRCVSWVNAVWNGVKANTVYVETLQATFFETSARARLQAKVYVDTLQQGVFSTPTTVVKDIAVNTSQQTTFITNVNAYKSGQVAIATLQITQMDTSASVLSTLQITTTQQTDFATTTTAQVGGSVQITTLQITQMETTLVPSRDIFITTSQQTDFATTLSWVRPAYIFDWVNGAAGLSLGKLKESTTACIEVRRASDDATQNIGFDVNDKVDEAALQSFCGASEGFVQAIYDQSGTGNNAAQFDTARQAKIYDGANLITDPEGNPAMLFDGVDDFYEFGGSLCTGTKWRLFYVVSTFDGCVFSAGTQADGTYDLWAEYVGGTRRIEQINSDPLPQSYLNYPIGGTGTRLGTINWGGFGDTPAVEMIDHIAYENNIEVPFSGGVETNKVISTGVTTYEIARNRWSPSGSYSAGYLSEIVIYSE
jgi:hypothetical protein